ncbi:MAG: phosphatase PAP2 family protein [Chromatiales bacterium]|jgi:acid phosphatase (class A)|nr:phosphatase PAP2 family protein [Chromatiales bacterium]
MRLSVTVRRSPGLLLALWSGLALAAPPPPYLTPDDLDLAAWIAPPPPPGSPAEQAERAQVLDAQRARTPAMVAAARRDQEISLAGFAAVLGPGFTAERLPLTFALGQRLCRDAAAITGVAKRAWQRPRPFVVEPAIAPVVAFSTDGSYPSGHATCGYLWGLMLGELFPDRRAALLARGLEYGSNRLVGGVHYPSDIEAGRLAAVAIMASVRRLADFEADLAAASDEARAVMAAAD